MVIFLTVFLCSLTVKTTDGQNSYELNRFLGIFSTCRRSDLRSFDNCMKTALNNVSSFFKSGIPELGVAPFDPFFAEEIVHRGGRSDFGYNLTLRNVYESGWIKSNITKFSSDLAEGVIRYDQWFPEKYLQGQWEIESNIISPFSNSGTFDLSLYNYTQSTTIRKADRQQTSFSVHVEAMNCGDLKLHISNLLKGRAGMELILNRLINIGWRPGFSLLKPLINDLVSKAFTKIFNDDFRNFPFDAVIPR